MEKYVLNRRQFSNLFIFTLVVVQICLVVINLDKNSKEKSEEKSCRIEKNIQAKNNFQKNTNDNSPSFNNSIVQKLNRNFLKYKVLSKNYFSSIKISSIPRRVCINEFLISGLVLDKFSQQPISNVILKLRDKNQNWTIKTDSDGFFNFTDKLKTPFLIHINKRNYSSFSKEIVLSKLNKNNYFVFELKPTVLPLQSVTVFAKNHRTQIADYNTHFGISEKIHLSQITNNPSGLNDLFRSFVTLPSVTTTNDFGSLLYVRGGTPEQNLFLLDEFKFPYPYRLRLMLGGGISAFIPELIKEAEIIPGGYSVQYGNKLSSVVKVNTIEKLHQKTLKLRLDFLTSQAIFSYPCNRGKTNLLLAGRRSIFETYASRLLKSSFVIPKFFDFYSKLSHQISPNHKLKISFLHAKEGIKNPTFSQESMNVKNGSQNTLLGVNLSSQLSKKFSSNVSFSIYSDRNKLQFIDNNSSFNANLLFYTNQVNLSGKLTYQYFPDIKFEAGTNFNFSKSKIQWDSDWRTKLKFPIHIKYMNKIFNYSNFFQTHFSIFNQLKFSLGLRQDYYSSNKQLLHSPRINFNLRLNQTSSLFGAVGQYYQPPDLMSMLTRSEFIDLTQNMSSLKVEGAKHFIIGFEKRWDNSISCKINSFYKQYSNLILPSQTSSYVAKNCGEAVAKGLEFMIKKKSSLKLPISASISYSRSVAKYRYPSSNWIPFSWDHPHAFNSAFEFKPMKNLTLGLNWTYRSGFPYSPLQNFSDASQKFRLKNSKRYPAFNRFDAKLKYDFKTRNQLSYSLYMDLLNFTNQKNLYAYNWGIAQKATQNNNSNNPIYMMPFVLSIGITVDF